MTMNPRALTLCLLAATSLAAQQYTSPAGYLNTEGSGSRWYTSYAHVDDTLRGQGSRAFTRLSLRRDGDTPASSIYAARQTTVAVRIAHADWAGVINNDVQPDSGYRVGWWLNAFAAKTVSLPSLAAQPITPPAPFAIQLPFDTPFYYNGTQAFTLQLRSSPSTLGVDVEYPLDRVESTSYLEGPTTTLGTGCTVSGRTTPMRHSSLLRNYGDPGMSYWQLVLSSAPASSPTLLLIGTAGADFPFGGCTNLRVTPTVVAS